MISLVHWKVSFAIRDAVVKGDKRKRGSVLTDLLTQAEMELLVLAHHLLLLRRNSVACVISYSVQLYKLRAS
jgi:hypothetical protein